MANAAWSTLDLRPPASLAISGATPIHVAVTASERSIPSEMLGGSGVGVSIDGGSGLAGVGGGDAGGVLGAYAAGRAGSHVICAALAPDDRAPPSRAASVATTATAWAAALASSPVSRGQSVLCWTS